MSKRFSLITFISFITSFLSFSQQEIDGVAAVVGSNIILKSEVEKKLLQFKEDKKSEKNIRCSVLEDLLFNKLLLAQAQKDSVTVTDAQVESEMDRRLRYFLAQFASTKEFEEFYGKSVDQFKDEFKDEVRNLLLMQKMQQKITGEITVSPAEVKQYFNSLPPDSVPFINAEIEIGQILKLPKVSLELKQYAREKINEIRDKITTGKMDFITAAKTYSQDPGSASKGGLYEHVRRGSFVPEFEAVAFKLKPGEISDVFETPYGLHIARLEARRGEEIDVRHILIIYEPSPADLLKARSFLDSLAQRIMADSISFTEAASRCSDDEETRNSGGLITNPATGSTRFEMSQLSQIDPALFPVIDKLETGKLSPAMLTNTHDAKQAYKVIYVKTRTQPHKENMKDDYQKIQNDALAEKQKKVISEWIKKKAPDYYVRIAPEYQACHFDNPWPVK